MSPWFPLRRRRSCRKTPSKATRCRPSRQLSLEPLEERTLLSGTYTGTVFEDYNANGVFDTSGSLANNGGGSIATAIDHGLAGVTVTAFDSAGAARGTTTSAADGSFTLNATGTGPYRIQFTNLPAGLSPGPHGSDNGTTVQFVPDGGATGVSLGLVNPLDYSVDNPTLAAVSYVYGDQVSGSNSTATVLYGIPYSGGATDPGATTASSMNPAPSSVAFQVAANQLGTVFGLSYDQASNTLYAAAYTKLHTGYGPTVSGFSGNGTIYAINPTTGAVSPFVNLNQLFGAGTAGVDFRAGYPAGNAPYFQDSVFTSGAYRDATGNYTSWDAVGKTSLGGIAVSSDGKTLYAMNLADRTLYVIPTDLGRPVTAADITRVPIPDASTVPFATGGTADNPQGDLQPFALTFYQGKLYVGIINSAESTTDDGTSVGDATKLRAYVYTVDPTSLTFSANPVFMSGTATDGGMDYPRALEARYAGAGPGDWHPWNPVFHNASSVGFVYAQPMLTGIAFDAQGNMVLGLRDRAGDQGGDFTPVDPGNESTNYETYAAGETWEAFRNGAGGWTLENNTTGPLSGQGPTAGQNLGTGPGGGQYYYQQDYDPTGGHGYVTSGAVTAVPGFPDVVVNAFDPTYQGDFQTGGLRWFNTTAGNEDKAYTIYGQDLSHTTNFGKAAGIGGLTWLSPPAPIEIGNRVWNDSNGNGIQDPDEPGIPGVTVDLYDATGTTLLGTTKTDSQGDYYFNAGDVNAALLPNGLQPNTSYVIRLDNASDYTGTGPLAGYMPTSPFAGSDPSIDSHGVPESATSIKATLTTGGPGASDHTADFGFVPLTNVAVTKTADARAVVAGGTAGFTITLTNTGSYTALGLALSDPLPALGGSNTWNIDTSTGNFASFALNGAAGTQALASGVTSLAAGASLTVHIVGVTTPSGSPYTATLTNTATVDATNEVNHNQQASASEQVLSPNVTVTKTADAASVTAGGQAGFSITITNTGLGQATGLTLSDPLPALGGSNAWNIDTSTGNFASFALSGAAGTQTLGLASGVTSLAAGASLTVHIVGITTPGATLLTNTATVDATNEVNHNQQGTATVSVLALSIGDFVWNDANNNGIFDPGEQALANVPVALLNSGGTVIATTTTDSNGHYEFDNLTPGTYTVRVTPPTGFASSTGTNGSASGPFEPGVSGTQNNEDHGTTNGAFITSSVTLGLAGSAQNPDNNGSGAGTANFRQDFGLFQPLSLGDFIWNDANNNGRFDPGETGIGRVLVDLVDPTGKLVASTTSNAQGGYLFTDLIPGPYRVVLPASNFAPGGALAGMISSTGRNGSASGPFEPAPGNTGNNTDHGTTTAGAVEGPLVNLAVGTAPTGETPPPGNLVDPAVDANSDRTQDFGFFTPLALGDFVFIDLNNDGILDNQEPGLPNAPVRLFDSTGAVVAATTTDGTGHYLFDDLIPGSYRVQVLPPAGYVSSTGRNGFASGPFEPGSTVFSAATNSTDHGTQTGASITSSAVTLNAPGSNPDRAGTANLNVDFGVFPASTLAGYVFLDLNGDGVRDGRDPGLGGVMIALTGPTLPAPLVTFTAADGSFSFGDLIAGTYTISRGPLPANLVTGQTDLGTVSGIPTGSLPGGPLSLTQVVPLGPASIGQAYAFSALMATAPLGSMLPVLPDAPTVNPTAVGKLGLLGSDLFGLAMYYDSMYVNNLYNDLLHRAPSQYEVNLWVQALLAGVSRQVVADDLWASPEHRWWEVAYLYQTILGRGPDPGALTFVQWLSMGATENDVAAVLYSSAEYAATHSSAVSYIVGLYGSALGRAPTPGELAIVQSWLQAGLDRFTLAQMVLNSPQAGLDAIATLYVGLLGRPADAGASYWMSAWTYGGDWTGVAEGLLASDEYYYKPR